MERTVLAMQALATNARIIILAVAVIGLGAWHLMGMRTMQSSAAAQEPDANGPLPMPELVDDRRQALGWPAAEPLVADRLNAWDVQPTAVSGGAPPSWIAAGSSAQDLARDPPDERALLDNVFAPERFVQVPMGAQSAGEPQEVDEVVARQDGLIAAAIAVPGAPASSAGDAGLPSDKLRAANEKAFYEQYLALAKDDVAALDRQAVTVLTPDGETARQVALLRALYGTDRAQSLEHFTKAMASLPDVSRPAGVSVPVFAAGFLARQTGDPAAVTLAERIAWNGHLNVSQEVRNAAATVLLSRATPADLQRYASYPGFTPPMQESGEP
jgi:hypothetical protein